MGKYKGFHPTKMSKIEQKVYSALGSMHQRCKADPDSQHYNGYAGRGIAVCDRYSYTPEGMANLIFDIGLPPTMEHQIDRENNNLGYVEGNLRWATRSEQARNRRNGAYAAAQAIKWEDLEFKASQSTLISAGQIKRYEDPAERAKTGASVKRACAKRKAVRTD